jgi:DNA mismatch repair ATPase MutL
LDRRFLKNDFQTLKVIGQFNKGFILAVLPRTNELFILD